VDGSNDIIKLDGVLGRIKDTWNDENIDLARKVRVIGEAYTKTRMKLENVADLLEITPAELQATLNLAALDDEDLNAISKVSPSKTTFFLFASADKESIEAAIQALQTKDKIKTEVSLVFNAICEVIGPTVDDMVPTVSAESLGHFAHKAKEYGKLSSWGRKFLVDISIRKRSGKNLTPKQIGVLKKILYELVESGVVAVESKDSDQEKCDEVLEALGMK
jgi:hypothetical protein